VPSQVLRAESAHLLPERCGIHHAALSMTLRNVARQDAEGFAGTRVHS
jgi:hypothetical protein